MPLSVRHGVSARAALSAVLHPGSCAFQNCTVLDPRRYGRSAVMPGCGMMPTWGVGS